VTHNHTCKLRTYYKNNTIIQAVRYTTYCGPPNSPQKWVWLFVIKVLTPVRYIYKFFTLAFDGGAGTASRPGRFTHRTGGWVGKKCLIRTSQSNNEQALGRPAQRLVTILTALRVSNHREMRESIAVPGEVRKLCKQRWVIVTMPPLPPTPIKLCS
jgi:hypothetical protein